MKLPISKPLFGDAERLALIEPLETGWVVQGPKVAEFERRFAQYVGGEIALATSSCTTALQLSLQALGVGPGDEVIVPAFTWIATANVVVHQGATPVFVDIDLDTFNMNVEQTRTAITKRTKAIIPVSLFGLSADLFPIIEFSRARGIAIVEDAACATGTLYHGHHAGTLGDVGCFSFHPRKSITTGEGGMITTKNPELGRKLKSLRDHGASISDLARHQRPRSYQLPDFEYAGHNARMTDFQGALGAAQMLRLPEIMKRRIQLAERYNAGLAGIPWLRTPHVPPDCVHAYQAYVTLFAPQTPSMASLEPMNMQRNALMDHLEAAGIATRPGTHAVHMLGYYRDRYGLRARDCPNAALADGLSMAIPLYPQLTDAEQDYVIETIRNWKPDARSESPLAATVVPAVSGARASTV